MAMISVIMPLYNKAGYVARAIDSIFAQTWHDFEIVVVDDGSTDNSPEIVESYKDDRIRLIRQSNAGPGAARNRGMKEATSQYVAFLDADDEFLPDFLKKSITNLKNNPDCVLSVANHYRGPEKTVATTIFPFNIGIESGPWRLHQDCEPNVLWGSLIFMQTWVTVCRRDAILKYGGFYEHRCTYGEDQYLWLQILLNCRIYRDTTPLFWYHTEDSELEIWARKSATPIWPFLKDPNPVRKNCPSEYGKALEKMFSYAAALNYSYMVPEESVVNFWREYLKGIPETHELPLDRPRPKERSGKEAKLFFSIDDAVSTRIRALCDANSITPDIFFLACFAFLVWKYSTQETLVIGTLYSSREQEEIQGLFGCFIRSIPVRFDVNNASDIKSWLAYVMDQYISAWAHTSIGLEDMIDIAAVQRSSNVNPISQIAYVFCGREADGISGNDLALYMRGNDLFEGTFGYSTDIFDADTMEMFSANFVRMVLALSEKEGRLDQIGLMDSKAWKLVEQINHTDIPEYLGRTFPDLFRESVTAFRDSAAVKSEDGTILTYNELDDLSDAIARGLVSAGVKCGEFVGMYLNRDKWLLPSLIGVFKAGGAYVPLDPHFPAERNTAIIADAAIRYIVTTSPIESETAVFGSDKQIVCADKVEASQVTLPELCPDQTAYVLFTSGSTGKPKGVPIRHDSLANLLLSMKYEPGISHNDIVLGITTFTFDISTLEFFLPLISGAKLVLAEYETSIDAVRLVTVIEDENITFMQATPSRWTLILETGWKPRPGMIFLTGGEALPQVLGNALMDTGASVWNMYGPTETTVWSSLYHLQRGDNEPSIGKPIANTGFFVLDSSNRVLPACIPGELAISGAGLSEGYLNRTDLTSSRFIEIDNNNTRQRVYKTGDLVLQKPSGEFRYFGRTDFQVKIRGFRIELGEIESVILGFPGIREAVCSVWARSEKDKRIVAYYRSDLSIDESELKAHIKKSLPDYMIPGHFMAMADFPLTSSGKTDRKALPLPDASAKETAVKAAATALHEQILAIWREVLGIGSIGIDDNFFDLGGHSILAVELIRKLNARIGGKWKLRDLFETPTVEGLACLLGSTRQTGIPLIFPVCRQGTGTPLFLVAGVYANRYFEDNSFSYEDDFLRYFNNILLILGNERRVYGLRPRGIYFGERFHSSIDIMADEYIDEIKKIQPNGPYLIGGECLGGIVAYAIARKLAERGDEVSRLVLLDTYCMKIRNEIVMRTIDYLRNVRNALKIILHTDFSRAGMHELADKALIWFFPVTRHYREKRYYERGPRRYANLLMRYRLKRYDGKTMLIINEEWNARHPSLCWDYASCPNLDIRVIPGNHETRLKLQDDALKRCFKEGLDQ